MSDRERKETGDWEAVGSDAGLRSVHVYASDCTIHVAAQQALDRILAKYGATTGLANWSISVWGRGANAHLRRRFYTGMDGRAIPLDGGE